MFSLVGSQILRCPDVAMIWGRGVGFKGLTWPPAVGSGLIPLPEVLDKALMGVKTPWSWMLTRNGGKIPSEDHFQMGLSS